MQESNLQLSKVAMSFTYLQNKITFIAFVNSNTVSQNFLNTTPHAPLLINIHNHYLFLLNTSY